eukprot:gnl/MRDRNA2_/MRDRNA2_167903_c0_seq1.p1 gnl/MRDRNA2_/MRDRNA2_167903_c0~~gnl/MRDRNA2_/MRDRNA2_167903_c0_seq1.p1  ORF type:complete len:418 (-),score=57.47 gnl/MRDRNA2_/MRDRNA2_167903_c0_seq1:13-1266(-)
MPPQAAKGPTDARGLVASIKAYVFASVAGPGWQRVLYFLCLIGALISFIVSSVSIIRSAAEGKITTVEVDLVDEVPLPAMFGCTPQSPGYPDFVDMPRAFPNSPGICPAGQIGRLERNNWGVGASSECFRVPTCWTQSNTLDLGFDYVESEKEKNFFNMVTAHFRKVSNVSHWACFLINAGGGLVSKRTDPLIVDITFHVQMDENTAPLFGTQGYIGLFDAALSGDLEDIMQGNGQTYTANMVNAQNTMKITYDEKTDDRGGIAAVLTDGRSVESKITNLYSASMSSVPFYYNRATPEDELQFYGLPWVKFRFEVSSFVSRKIYLRNKYLSEMWVEFGGAWAGALLIISCFFIEKVGGVTGKVQVFRFNTPKNMDELTATASRELGAMMREQVADIKEQMTDAACRDLGAMQEAAQV